MSKKADPRNRTFNSHSKAYKAWLAGHSFVPHTAELLASLAWRGRSIHATRLIDLLELEHARHNGSENGFLKLTHRQMRAGGISSDYIAPTIAEVEILGLVTVTHRGAYRGGARNDPSTYRLNYLPWKFVPATGAPVYYAPTDDWAKYDGQPARQKSFRKAHQGDQPKPTRWTKSPSGLVRENRENVTVLQSGEWPTPWGRSSILGSTHSEEKQGAAVSPLDQRGGDIGDDRTAATTALDKQGDRKESRTAAISPVDRDPCRQPSTRERESR